ncbi:hypothetical protein PRIPAC_71798 [Pristionchus pacificus]|nr:hypothetical protein PRIPAC_71798 [Pristionchus pacificus]
MLYDVHACLVNLPIMSTSPKKRGNTEEETGWSTILAKALRPGSEWSDKDDLLDVLYWGRQVFALFLGVVFGVIPLSGVIAIVIYAAISTLAGQYFVCNYQGADEETMGGFWELAKEGFGTAFATFLVSWITTYSAIHHD